MPPIRNLSFVTKEADNKNVEADPADPFTSLGIIFFVTAVLFSLIGFGVTYFLEQKNNTLRDDIQKLEVNLKSIPLDEMLSFYSKTQNINSVLKEHVYLTTVLSLLENAVESNVYFKKFDFSYREGAGYDLAISAIAPDTRSVVRQMDTLKSPKYSKVFKSVELKNITKDKFENVTFEIKITVIPTVKNEAFDFILTASSTNASSSVEATTTIATTTATTTKATSTNIIKTATTSSSSAPVIKKPL